MSERVHERGVGPAWLIVCCALIAPLPAISACGQGKDRFQPKDPLWRSRAMPRTPLPDSAFNVRWEAHAIAPELRAGTETVVRIAFTNLGDAVWPDPLAGDPDKRNGGYAVRLTYHWVDAAADPAAGARASATKPVPRVDLPHPVRPGETIPLLVALKAPAAPGRYRLVVELLQELVAWFDAKGGVPLVVPVVVR